jgi:hypothetical protein
VGKVPLSVWLRLEKLALVLREETEAFSIRLLQHTEAQITALNGFTSWILIPSS